jgi:xylulose-5-phosphate/fructose-6-phosphate phosphoketolase
MPGEVIDRPNPQPLASNIPDHVQDLAIKLQNIELSDADRKGLEEFRRASNYIAAGKENPVLALLLGNCQISLLTKVAMIFLQDNALLDRDLTFEDIKPR